MKHENLIPNMLGKSKKKLATSLALAAACVASLATFQNCSGSKIAATTRASTFSQGVQVQGNGEGYGGKLSFVRSGGEGPCADGHPQSQILVDKDLSTAEVVRENCSDIAPKGVEVASLSLMPHNMNHLVYHGTLYQQDRDQGQSNPSSTLLCRGQDNAIGENNKVDAIIQTVPGLSPPKFVGRVILGLYDSFWNLVDVKDMGVVGIEPDLSTSNDEHTYYHNAQGEDHFMLDVFRESMTAELYYFKPVRSAEGEVPTEFRFVRGLNCFTP
ncbi:MAG: hypothetical protein AB7G93_19620 [Bdellovibrionales bacterium]